MMEVPPPKRIDEANAIIIDQQRLIRDTLKSVLVQAGVRDVTVCSNAFEALSACRSKDFDLIFVSFNLNLDKDGFHFLEELKFKNYAKNTTGIVFLSADTDKGLVNSVIEMQPDDFWLKPFDLNSISKRLNFMLEVKQALHKPLFFADEQDYSRAIYYSDRLLALSQLKEFHPRLLRLKGQCLMTIKEYGDAEKHYSEVLKKYRFNWVYIGLAKSLLKQEKFTEAQALIDKLKLRPDTRCGIHDLLGQHYLEKGQYEKAYVEIIEAAKLAPRNLERNKRTWELARLNHDPMGQRAATINMAKYAKNSIHDSPELTLNVIRANIDVANYVEETESGIYLNEAQKHLNELATNPKLYRLLKNQIDVINARLHSARGEKSKAEGILRQLHKNDNDDVENNLEYNFDLIKAHHAAGNREACIRLLNESKELVNGNMFSGDILNKYIEQELDERSHIHFTAKELTEMASAYHTQQKYDQAIRMLDQAFKLSPRNEKLAMNIMKVAASISENSQMDNNQKRTVSKAVMMLNKIDLAPEDAKLYAFFREQIGEINQLDLLSTELA